MSGHETTDGRMHACTNAQTKFSIEHTSVGLAHARPTRSELLRSLCRDDISKESCSIRNHLHCGPSSIVKHTT